MATITVENVPDKIVKKYGTRIKFSYDLFVQDDFDIDFKELDKNEVSSDLFNSIENTKKIPKSKLINLSREYVNN